MPWMNAPSTWPMSIAGLIESPASCSRSARSSFHSPVSVSTIDLATPRRRRRSRRTAGPSSCRGPSAAWASRRSRRTRAGRAPRRPRRTSSRKRRSRLPLTRHRVGGEAHVLGAAAVARRPRTRPGARGSAARRPAPPCRSGRCRSTPRWPTCWRPCCVSAAVRAHVLEADAELVRDDLRDLGVEALPHLGAAVVHQHRAVGVDVHQRAGLVVMHDVERDAELDRRQREAASSAPGSPR